MRRQLGARESELPQTPPFPPLSRPDETSVLPSARMEPHPHDVDVKALLRIAVVYNIPIACTRNTANFLISSPLMKKPYQPAANDYTAYIGRKVEGDD